MHYQIELTDSKPITTAVIRSRVPAKELSQFVPTACGEVWSFVRSAGLPRPGRHLALYLDDGSVIEIERQMASWSRESGRSNERPHLAARGGHELRQLFCWHPASNHSGRNRLRIRQFDLIVHTLFWLTSHVPPAPADCHDSPPGKHWNDPKQIQPGQMPQGQASMLEKQVRLKIR